MCRVVHNFTVGLQLAFGVACMLAFPRVANVSLVGAYLPLSIFNAQSVGSHTYWQVYVVSVSLVGCIQIFFLHTFASGSVMLISENVYFLP